MLKNYVILLAIGLIWGSQFIFQEIALSSFSPVWIGTLRALLGALTLWGICRLLRIESQSKQWRLFALIGLLEAVIPFVLVPWAQQTLSSSMAAILMGTLPFYALLLAPLLISGATMTRGCVVSLLVGFSGLLVLFSPDLFSASQTINIGSALVMICAAVSFAVALLLLHRVRDEHPLIVARNVLTMAAIQLVCVAVLTTPLVVYSSSVIPLAALGYLGVMCAGVVYYLYMMSIKNAGPVFTSMTNYLVPAVGVLIAALLTDESIQVTTWLALAIILAALCIHQVSARTE